MTDVEIEHTVQDLLKEESCFNTHISNPAQSPLPSSPAQLSLEVNFTIPNPFIPTFDLPSFNPETNQKPSDVQARASSPTMPVLTVELLDRQPETVSPCLSASCPLSDPYSLPPVLSPQVTVSDMDPKSPYLEPPILSPQKYIGKETLEEDKCEVNLEEYGFTVSLSTLLQTFGIGAEEERGLNPLEDPPQSSSRSHSLPWLSAVSPNPKKRCQSASPEHRNGKRRRTMSGESCGIHLEPPVENASTSTASCFVDFPLLKPSCSTFSPPAVQNFPPTPTQMNSASFPDGHKPQYAISNQDSFPSASVRIEPALIPNQTTISSASSDSDWDCDLLSRLGPTSATRVSPSEQQNRELDKELLHRSCPWMHDTVYESHLSNALQPSTPAALLCGEDTDSQPFSRTVVQIVEVLH